MIKFAKSVVINIMVTTAISSVVLGFISLFVTFDPRYAFTIFTNLLANTAIHLGMVVTRKFECRYFALEYLLDTAYITVVLIASGFFFGWFYLVNIWILVGMAVGVNGVAVILGASRVRSEVDTINNLLKERDTKIRKLKRKKRTHEKQTHKNQVSI